MFPVYYRFAALFVFTCWTKTLNPHLEFMIWAIVVCSLIAFSWLYLFKEANNGEIVRVYTGYGDDYYSKWTRDWKKFGRNYMRVVLGIET